jgi:hypothetical protein
MEAAGFGRHLDSASDAPTAAVAEAHAEQIGRPTPIDTDSARRNSAYSRNARALVQALGCNASRLSVPTKGASGSTWPAAFFDLPGVLLEPCPSRHCARSANLMTSSSCRSIARQIARERTEWVDAPLAGSRGRWAPASQCVPLGSSANALPSMTRNACFTVPMLASLMGRPPRKSLNREPASNFRRGSNAMPTAFQNGPKRIENRPFRRPGTTLVGGMGRYLNSVTDLAGRLIELLKGSGSEIRSG